MDCTPPGSPVHVILQTRVLEWVAISFSKGSSRPRDWTHVSHIVGRLLSVWATREVQQLLGLGPNLSPRGVTASLIKGTWDRTGKPGPRPAGRCSEDAPPSNYIFFFLFYFIFKLYITVLVLPNIKMNPPQVHQITFKGRMKWLLLNEMWFFTAAERGN